MGALRGIVSMAMAGDDLRIISVFEYRFS